MSTMGTASVGTLTAANGAGFTGPMTTTKTIADAMKILIERTLNNATAGFIQVSNNFDENNPDPVAAAAAASWRTLQRPAGTDVVPPISLLVGIEFDPFVCKAFRIAAGTSGAPTTFAGITTFNIYKQFEL